MEIKSRKAQEEMVGFALIIILVAVIILIFVGLSIRTSESEAVESYEVESFVQVFLQYTTDCRDNLEPISIQKLIIDCRNNEFCLDGRNSCDVLNKTITGIVEESWPINENSPVRGYELKILSDGGNMVNLNKGNLTSSSKGAVQYLPNDIEILFSAYY